MSNGKWQMEKQRSDALGAATVVCERDAGHDGTLERARPAVQCG